MKWSNNLYNIRKQKITFNMSTNNKKQDLQKEIEDILRNNSSRSYSKVEIMNLMSSDNCTEKGIEKTLVEMEVWSSMKDPQVSVYSSCKGGTVYFQWGQAP
jgi:hypothetical protein